MTFRDNILSILNHMQNMGGVMSDMPALPVRMNVEMANNFLPRGPPGLGIPPFTLSMQVRLLFLGLLLFCICLVIICCDEQHSRWPTTSTPVGPPGLGKPPFTLSKQVRAMCHLRPVPVTVFDLWRNRTIAMSWRSGEAPCARRQSSRRSRRTAAVDFEPGACEHMGAPGWRPLTT